MLAAEFGHALAEAAPANTGCTELRRRDVPPHGYWAGSAAALQAECQRDALMVRRRPLGLCLLVNCGNRPKTGARAVVARQYSVRIDRDAE